MTGPEDIKILVVDDSPPMRQLVLSMLRSFGYMNVQTANDGAQALRHTEGHAKLDMIICDIEMEPMSSIEFLRELRRDEENPSRTSAVIMLTGNNEMESIIAARNAGMDEYLVKPISPARLKKRIESVLSKNRTFVVEGDYVGPERRGNLGKETPAAPPSNPKQRQAPPKPEPISNSEIFTEEVLNDYYKTLLIELKEAGDRITKLIKSKGQSADVWQAVATKLHQIKGHSGSYEYHHISRLSNIGCEVARHFEKAENTSQDRLTAMIELLIAIHFTMSYCAGENLRNQKSLQLKAMTNIFASQASAHGVKNLPV